MNIVQFTPYYPPHVWWVEKVVFDVHHNWSYWKSVVFTSDIWQDNMTVSETIICYPAFNIVNNFPFPRFWNKNFWKSLKQLKKYYSKETRIITHTRFFFSSFLWAFLAKKNRVKHIHIEHGSGFVKSWNFLVNILSKIYDKTFWKYCINNANRVLGISKVSSQFLKNNFWKNSAWIWYRGMNFSLQDIEKKSDEIMFVYIGRLTWLKKVEDIVKAYKDGNFIEKCIIIGDGEKKQELEKKSQWLNIEFYGQKSHTEIIDFLQKNRCIVINPSSQEWLPTTVLEWLITKNMVIATDVWGTKEISSESDLLFYNVWNIPLLITLMHHMLEQYSEDHWKSYEVVTQKFSMEKSMRELYDHIKQW